MVPSFKNEPFTDFSQEANRRAMFEAIAKVESEFGREYPLIIGGKRHTTGDLLKSVNPSQTDQVVGWAHRGSSEHVDQALEAAWKAFAWWGRRPAEERARYLFQVAHVMRRRKFELAAWIVLEVGKSWAEADADVAEAIDMCEFYGRQAIQYDGPRPVTPSPLPNEHNEWFYIPLGAGAIIPPWNFPLAILVGMTMGAVAAGNTVVVKPSSDSPIIAAKFMEVLEEASFPEGVVNYLPGAGSKVGDYLVAHPRTRFIAFTGSMEVGLRINEMAARTSPGQIWIKRVIAEMGGKNAIIVDSSADLDAAAEGIVISAYGYSGQKCSACSRAIFLEDVYEAGVEKVIERAQKITVGPTKDPANWMGPVVSQSAYQSILGYIEIGKSEGKLLLGGHALEEVGNGWFIAPTIFGDVSPSARIAQEEIFGPVLACLRARDFDHALEIANGTVYGLTGGVYSRTREHIERARREFHVGNLYINRKITGALVDVHPFGGFNMSGTDSKAGGRDYLLLFLQAKSVAEKF
ncbi:MAG: L-glutamate gamma-semialdehyde dehydrogenase [Blastocatellia bacterium]|nr:L-glutamate gamma-semialdehyde dehydrogenase [Blastocatellia bacterium]MCS7157552.1 L-glutamate gamma-semialdehyde dehydrogenase [Blastocatellia bacterium]MDW8257497.1 L-glutamate gamma-semialdehyde dehydrogenase [Acidobacteriota bacterium]